jgi:integrase/recombinase XerD
MQPAPVPHTRSSLFTAWGERKYLSRSERARALDAAKQLPPHRTLFCLTLAFTGARISEVLALRPIDFMVDDSIVTLRTLKRRCFHIRQVPVPPFLMTALEQVLGLRSRQADPGLCTQRVWTFHRVTAWRIVKSIMAIAGLRGAAACPKAFRHSFGTTNVLAAMPLTLLQRWLGHACLESTAVYTQVQGPEESELAKRYWQWLDDPH